MVKKRLKSNIRQDQIIDAARKLVVKHGSEHVTVGRIAKEVGISEGAIYRHFKSKSAVLSGLADRISDDLLGDINDHIYTSSTSLEFLDTVLKNHLSTIQQRKGISFQVIAEIISFGDKKLNKKVSEVINNYVISLKHLLSEGIKTGEVKEDTDIEAAAFLLFGMIQGLVNIWALSNYDFDLEKKYERLWKVFRTSITRT
jgi:TetR/AcrR family fatty acid metabolism transcriptional regulator